MMDRYNAIKHQGPFLWLSRKRFDDITRWLRQKEIDEEEKRREEECRRYFKQKSTEMAEKWPDSIENIKNRESERREMQKKLRDEMSAKQVERFEEFHKQERRQLIEEAQRKILIQNTPNVALSKALLETYIRAENDANLKLKEEMRKREEEREKEWVELVYKGVEEYNKQEKETKCKAREKAKYYQAFHLKQMKEKLDADLNGTTERLKEEHVDLEKLEDEISERREIELENAKERQRKMKNIMEIHLRETKKKKERLKVEENELREVCSIFNDTFDRRNCAVKKQYKKEINDAIDERWNAGVRYRLKIEPITEIENRRYINQVAEKEKIYQKEQKEAADKRTKIYEERNETYIQSKKKISAKQKVEDEMLRYRIAERLKETEEIQKYDSAKRKKDRKAEIEFTQEWDAQIREKKRMMEAIPKKVLKTRLNEIEDKTFYTYAKEVLEHVRSRGWDDYPIRREMKNYCKRVNIPLYPECLQTSKPQEAAQCTNLQMKLPKI